MKAILPLALLAAQAVAAPLESTQRLDNVIILPVEKLSVSDTSPDGAAPLLVEARTLPLGAFDPINGVLVGARGRLVIDPNHGLMAYRNESGGDWDSVATLRSGWTLGGQVLGTGTVILQRVTSNRDTPVVIGTNWGALAFDTSTALDRFVGTGTLSPTLTTAIGAFISDGGGGSTAIASVLAMNAGSGGADPDGLTAGISWTYSYLRHAQLSFDAVLENDVLALDLAAGPGTFSLHALGDAATTGADVLGWTCTGDCAAFSLQLDTISGLSAGGVVSGAAHFVGAPGTHAATFLLEVADDATIGSIASRGSHTLSLKVEVSAVPEPTSALLMATGLAWLGLRRRFL